MGKVTNYIAILGITLGLFWLAGLIQNTPNSILLGLIINPQNIFTSTFWTSTINLITIVSAAGIVIGSLLSQKTDLAIFAPFVLILINFTWDIVSIINIVGASSPTISKVIGLIMGTLLVLFIFSVVEWWRGKD